MKYNEQWSPESNKSCSGCVRIRKAVVNERQHSVIHGVIIKDLILEVKDMDQDLSYKDKGL